MHLAIAVLSFCTLNAMLEIEDKILSPSQNDDNLQGTSALRTVVEYN